MEVKNERLTDEEFFAEREKVLAMWPTGREVNLDEAVEYLKGMPPHKSACKQLAEAKQKGKILISGIMAYTTIRQQTAQLLFLQNEGHAGLLMSVCDSFTRTLQYEAAERTLKEAEKTGKNLLNGFPFVAYGVKGARQVIEAVDVPLSAGGPAIDARLAAEIAYASGYTSYTGPGLVAYEDYSRTASFEEAVHKHQYVARLAGYYQEKGVPVLLGIGGGVTVPGTLPPSLKIARNVVSALETAAQGVKYLDVWSISQGNLIQDIASSITTLKTIRRYLDRFGYTDVEIFLTNGLIDGVYPLDHAQSIVEVLYAPIVSVLTEPQVCMIRSLDEADAIPTKENYAFSMRSVEMMLNLLKDQKIAREIDLHNSKAVKTEVEQGEREVEAIVDKILEIGDGDIIVGAKKAYEAGILDNPFPNNPVVKGKVMGVRDGQGATRYMDTGNLPFSKDILEFHKQKIAERAVLLGKDPDYDTVVGDMLAISRGSLLPEANK